MTCDRARGEDWKVGGDVHPDPGMQGEEGCSGNPCLLTDFVFYFLFFGKKMNLSEGISSL